MERNISSTCMHSLERNTQSNIQHSFICFIKTYFSIFWSRDSQVNFSIYFQSILAPMCFHPTPICKQANKNIDAHVFILVCSGALLVWPSLLRSTDARQVTEVVYRAETLLSTNTGALTSNMQYHIIQLTLICTCMFCCMYCFFVHVHCL